MICARAVSRPTLVARKRNGAGLVQGGADDLVSRALLHGDGFSGEHGLVDGRAALLHDAVHGDLLTRAHEHQIAGLHILHGDILFQPIPYHPRGLGLQADQPLDGFGRLTLGSSLQVATKQDQADDHHRGLVVHVGLEPRAGDALEQARKEGDRDRIQVGHRCPYRDQSVHVGGAVPSGGPGSPVELPPGPELHRCGQEEGQVPMGLHADEGGHPQAEDHKQDPDR